MAEISLASRGHPRIRRVLRVLGPVTVLVGVAFLTAGTASFFASFGDFDPPRYFWCAFVGLPILFVGSVLCMLGYVGDVQRFVAAETVPVASDAINHLSQSTQPAAKSVAKAITQGILEAQRERE